MVERIIVTGCSGQDGTILIEQLSQKDVEVVGTTRSLTNVNKLQKLYSNKTNVKIKRLNLENLSETDQFLRANDPDTVFHLAAQSSVGLSFKEVLSTEKSIIDVTYNLMTSISNFNKNIKVLNFCSGECFGECPSEGATEATNFQPKSPYANAKVSSALLVESFIRQQSLNAHNLFLFNHESEHRKPNYVTAKIIETALLISQNKAEKLTLGNLGIHRDWSYAAEVMSFLISIRNLQLPDRLVIGSGTSMSLSDFCKITFGHLGLNSENYIMTSDIFSRPTDISFSRANPVLAKNEFSWSPKYIGADLVRFLVNSKVRNK